MGSQPSKSDRDARDLEKHRRPIQACIDDILQLIFERDVEGAYHPFSAAVRLSQVCQRWRFLALSTPSLWRRITLRIESPWKDLTPMIDAFVARIKQVPVEVFIYIHLPEWRPRDIKSALSTIPFENIYRISAIRHLNINIMADIINEHTFMNVFDPILWDRIETLSLVLHSDYTVSINPFLGYIPRFDSLYVTGGVFGVEISPRLYIAGQKVTSIWLKEVTEFPLVALLRMTPILKSLTVLNCELIVDEGADICTMAHLEDIRIVSDGFTWNNIRCPALIRLHTPSEPNQLETDAFWNFISSTQTITYISAHSFHKPEYLVRLGSVCPQLHSLEASKPSNPLRVLANKTNSLGDTLFPNLLNLVIEIYEPQAMTVALKHFLQARCLPKQNPHGQMDPHTKPLLKNFAIRISEHAMYDPNTHLLEQYFTVTESPPTCSMFRYQFSQQSHQ